MNKAEYYKRCSEVATDIHVKNVFAELSEQERLKEDFDRREELYLKNLDYENALRMSKLATKKREGKSAI